MRIGPPNQVEYCLGPLNWISERTVVSASFGSFNHFEGDARTRRFHSVRATLPPDGLKPGPLLWPGSVVTHRHYGC